MRLGWVFWISLHLACMRYYDQIYIPARTTTAS
jgi:hypothetical protein